MESKTESLTGAEQRSEQASVPEIPKLPVKASLIRALLGRQDNESSADRRIFPYHLK